MRRNIDHNVFLYQREQVSETNLDITDEEKQDILDQYPRLSAKTFHIPKHTFDKVMRLRRIRDPSPLESNKRREKPRLVSTDQTLIIDSASSSRVTASGSAAINRGSRTDTRHMTDQSLPPQRHEAIRPPLSLDHEDSDPIIVDDISTVSGNPVDERPLKRRRTEGTSSTRLRTTEVLNPSSQSDRSSGTSDFPIVFSYAIGALIDFCRWRISVLSASSICLPFSYV